MHDAERQDRHVTEPLDEFEVELSDLPPSARSHHFLLRLNKIKGSLREVRQALFASGEPADQQTIRAGSLGDEDEVEFSDLPPSTPNHYRLIALKRRFLTPIQRFMHGTAGRTDVTSSYSMGERTRTRRPTHARVGRLLTTFGVCAALLILLLGNDPTLPNQLNALIHPAASTTTATTNGTLVYSSVQIVNSSGATPIDTRINHDPLGLLPVTCPQANLLQQFPTSSDSPPPGIGNRQLWITGFTGPVAALRNLRQVPPTLLIQEGFQWYTTLNLLIQKGYNEVFSLQGDDQLASSNLQFSDTSMSVAGPVFSFGLQDVATQPLLIDDGQWESLLVNVYLPSAGCYFLELNWSSGSRFVYFAAGS